MMKSNLKSINSRIFSFNLALGLLVLIFISISQCRLNIVGDDSPDQDNDGILDSDDLCPTGREFDSSILSNDRDGDGCFDDGYEDICLDYAVDNINSDGDTRCDSDARDLCPGNDGGTVFIDTSVDADSDGCEDTTEDFCPDYALDNTNMDGDTRCDSDARDLCPGNDGGTVFIDTSVDADSDGCEDTTEDFCPDYALDNTNIDGDTRCDSDARDLCPGNDGGTVFTATSVDADNDGCEDGLGNEDLCPDYAMGNVNPDMDTRCDSDARDLCPGTAGGTVFTATSVDADNDGCEDGVGKEDKCDGNAVSNEDDDSDGICGQYNVTSNPSGDNCPLISNSSQEDYDGDDLGDVCDGNLDDDHADEGSGDTDLCKKSPLNYPATDDVDNDGCKDTPTDIGGMTEAKEDLCLGYNMDNINPDMDEICDSDNARDLCPSGTIFTATSVDADNDGCEDGLGNEDLCPDYAMDNVNIDMDTICDSDARDLCPGTGGGTTFTATSVDADNDGCEDGLGNEDNCGGIGGNTVSNEDGDDDDLCGQLSATNTAGDSCPLLSNDGTNDHTDLDNNYEGNACDDDDDGDSVDDLMDIDDDGDGLIELDNDDMTANPGSITEMYRQNDGTHYNDGGGGITTGCGGLNSITTCKGYELIEDVEIGSGWNNTTPGFDHTTNTFSAIFDGNGHDIIITDNIESSTNYLGLFGHVSGVLRNFTLRSNSGNDYSFSKSVSEGNRKMGIVAAVLKGVSDTQRAVIDRVYVVNVNLVDSQTNNTSYNHVGGLVGHLEEYATVKNSYTDANIMLSTSGMARYRAGGLSGEITNNISINNSYATGNITIDSTVSLTGTSHFGGLIGIFSGTTNLLVSNCYATGNIAVSTNLTDATDSVYIGGLVALSNMASVSYSYATGNITNTGNEGNRFGGPLTYVESYTVFENSYYNVGSDFPDVATTNLALGGANSGIYGYTDAELKTPTTPYYSFVGAPSTDTSTELRCIARNGVWTAGAPGSCDSLPTSYALYAGWSTDNWDFGDATQLPALKFTDSDELIPGQR